MSDGGRQEAVTDEIVNYMREMISSGQWAVGSKIPSENQLRAILNVSRTSLRSAIMQLSALNILKAKQGIGTFVIAPLHDEAIFEESGKNMAAKREIVQLLEFLKIVAPTTIYLEMLKFNKCFKGLERQLHAIVDEQSQLAYLDQSLFLQSCFNFHVTIFNAIVNEFVKNSVLEAIARLQKALLSLQPTISSQVILTLHRKIIQAIETEDAKLARRSMKKLYNYLTSHDYLRNISHRLERANEGRGVNTDSNGSNSIESVTTESFSNMPRQVGTMAMASNAEAVAAASAASEELNNRQQASTRQWIESYND